MKQMFLFFFCFLAIPASAQISLCNKRADSLLIAVGADFSDEIFVFGWTELGSGQCSGSLQEAFAAAGKPAQQLNKIWVHGRNRLTGPSQEVGAGIDLCVDDVFDVFRADFADSTCEKRGYIRASFSEVSLSGNQTAGTVTISNQGFRFNP